MNGDGIPYTARKETNMEILLLLLSFGFLYFSSKIIWKAASEGANKKKKK